MRLLPIKTRALLPPKDNVYGVLNKHLPKLQEGDVLLIASKVLAIHQGRCIKLSYILKSELIKKGCIFKGASDTEVILKGFILEGSSFFSRLRGMWALAIFDKNKGELTLCRDHFGIKPLYFAHIKQDTQKKESRPQIIFASEIKPLISSGLIDRL